MVRAQGFPGVRRKTGGLVERPDKEYLPWLSAAQYLPLPIPGRDERFPLKAGARGTGSGDASPPQGCRACAENREFEGKFTD